MPEIKLMPLLLDLDMLEDAVTDSGQLSLLKEEFRSYFRKVLGKA